MPCSAGVITGSGARSGDWCPWTQSHSSSCNQNPPALVYLPVLPTDTVEWDFHQLEKGDLRLDRAFGLEQSLAKLLQQPLPMNPAMSCTCEMAYLTAPLLLVCIPRWGSPCPPCRDSHLLPTQLTALGTGSVALTQRAPSIAQKGEQSRGEQQSCPPSCSASLYKQNVSSITTEPLNEGCGGQDSLQVPLFAAAQTACFSESNAWS